MEGREKQAEDLLVALARAFRRREEAYQLSRRSALLEAEEADAAGLQQELQQLETRGAAFLEGLLQSGDPSSEKRLSNGATRGSELGNNRRLSDQARDLWRKAVWTVERQETARGIAPESLREVLGETLLGKSVPEEERRLLALLSEHRSSAKQAVKLFGSKATNDRMSGEENPRSSLETNTRDKESTMRVDTPSAEALFEEGLPGGQTRQDGSEMSVDPTAATSLAGALLTETRESIREVRLGLEKQLRGLKRQVEGGGGVAELERRLRRVLGQLADRDLEAASRFVRCYVLERGEEMKAGAKGGGESEPVLGRGSIEEEGLQSPEVQEALRRALPEGLQLDGQKGLERKSPSRSR